MQLGPYELFALRFMWAAALAITGASRLLAEESQNQPERKTALRRPRRHSAINLEHGGHGILGFGHQRRSQIRKAHSPAGFDTNGVPLNVKRYLRQRGRRRGFT